MSKLPEEYKQKEEEVQEIFSLRISPENATDNDADTDIPEYYPLIKLPINSASQDEQNVTNSDIVNDTIDQQNSETTFSESVSEISNEPSAKAKAIESKGWLGSLWLWGNATKSNDGQAPDISDKIITDEIPPALLCDHSLPVPASSIPMPNKFLLSNSTLVTERLDNGNFKFTLTNS